MIERSGPSDTRNAGCGVFVQPSTFAVIGSGSDGVQTHLKGSNGTVLLSLAAVCWLLLVATNAASPLARQDSRDGQNPDSPVGTWRGKSTCVVRPSGCRDEDSVYRVTATAGSDTRVMLAANKLVNGQEVNMGTSECSYSPATRVLRCPLPNGSALRFEISGESLNGTMVLKDGTTWRKIVLHRTPR